MRGTFIVLALSLSLCGTLAAVPALAASALRFSPPPRLGEIPAVTYDADGHPIGRARLAMTRTGEGLRINVETTLDNGERSSLSAAMTGGRARCIRAVVGSSNPVCSASRSIL